MPTLLWFRRDLRLYDLPALLDAAGDSGVLACFVLDPRLETASGPRRLQFLGDCLRELHAALDGRLLITRGLPEKRIPQICAAIDASSVHISADFSPFGMRRDKAVTESLSGADIPVITTGSPYLVSPGRVTKDDGSPYKVFTPYFRRWREVGWRGPAQSGPDSADWVDPCGVAGLPSRWIRRIPQWCWTFRLVRRRREHAGRNSAPRDCRATPPTGIARISRAPVVCRRI